MKKYKYAARTKEGAIYRGIMEAKNQVTVVEALQQKDLVVVSVEENIGFNLQSINEINIGGVPLKDKVLFMRQLATMISSGLPLTQALEILKNQATNPLFKKSLTEILTDVEGGTGFSTSLKKTSGIFDDITISLIEAGENTGHLDTVLQRLAVEIEKKKKLQDKLSGAMIYPVILILIMIGVMVLMIVVLIPSMKSIYATMGNAKLPAITLFFVGLSDFFLGYWWLIIIIVALIVIGVKYYLDTPGGKRMYSVASLKIPVFGSLIINMQVSQLTRVLALLLSSGLSILQALQLTSNSLDNAIFREAVLNAKKEVEKGIPLAIPISRSEVIPLIVSQMIAVGEETGKLDELLVKMAEFYELEVDVATSNLSTMIEPLMLIIMGVMIGIIAMAVYSPMFSLAGSMGK